MKMPPGHVVCAIDPNEHLLGNANLLLRRSGFGELYDGVVQGYQVRWKTTQKPSDFGSTGSLAQLVQCKSGIQPQSVGDLVYLVYDLLTENFHECEI